MTKVFILTFLICILCTSCLLQTSPKVDPKLVVIDSILESKPDSALFYLEEMDTGVSFDKYNKAYYTVLLTAAKSRGGVSCVSSDSLLDLAIHSLNEKRDYDLLARAYLYKGRIWTELEDSEAAIKAFQKSLELLEKYESEDVETLSKVYDDLGNIYIIERLYDKALTMFRKEYALDLERGYSRGLAFSLKNIGVVYFYENKPDSILYYFNEAMKSVKLSSDSNYLFNMLYNDLAVYYESKEEYDLAFEYLDKISGENESANFNKATLYYHLDQLDLAFDLLIELSASDNVWIQATSYDYLSKINYKKENYKDAYDYYQQYSVLADSINEDRKTNEFRVLDYKYNIQKETTKMKTNFRQTILIVFFVALLVVSIVIFYFVLKRKKAEIREKDKDNQLLRHEQDLFHKEMEIAGLNEKYVNVQNDIITLQKEKDKNAFSFQDKMQKKGQEISMLKMEIETKRFMTKPVFEHLLNMEKKVKANAHLDLIKPEEFNTVYRELENSFREFVSQLKSEYPDIKKEDIFILSMTKADFSSAVIGAYLNVSDSAVRQRIRRIRPKLPNIFNE